MKRILVTGAGGFVGQHLVKALAADDPASSVVGTGSGVGGGLAPLDVTDGQAVAALVREVRPTVCINLAAISGVPISFRSPRKVWDVNLGGTLNLAQALLEEVPDCRLIQASSGEIYGLSFRSGTAVDEETPLAPANPYAASKAAADLALGEMALRGLRLVRLRLFNHTGPGQSESYVVPRFAAQVARIAEGLQEPVIHTGSLQRWRDFLDIRDVIAAYLAAVNGPADNLCVNICSGVARRVGDVLDDLIRIAGITADIREQTSETRRTDIETALGSPAKAAAALGWRPQIPWTETLAGLLAHWRERSRARR